MARGFILTSDQLDRRLRPDDPIGALLGGVLFEVHVETPEPEVRAAEWRAFTHYISQVLDARQAVAR